MQNNFLLNVAQVRAVAGDHVAHFSGGIFFMLRAHNFQMV